MGSTGLARGHNRPNNGQNTLFRGVYGNFGHHVGYHRASGTGTRRVYELARHPKLQFRG